MSSASVFTERHISVETASFSIKSQHIVRKLYVFKEKVSKRIQIGVSVCYSLRVLPPSQPGLWRFLILPATLQTTLSGTLPQCRKDVVKRWLEFAGSHYWVHPGGPVVNFWWVDKTLIDFTSYELPGTRMLLVRLWHLPVFPAASLEFRFYLISLVVHVYICIPREGKRPKCNT